MAIGDLGIAPSEARDMTVAEIYAVIWAKTRHHKPDQDKQEAIYQDLQEALGR